VDLLVGKRPDVPNIVEMIELRHRSSLTRKTLTTIISQTENRQAALDNPQEFALPGSSHRSPESESNN